MIDVPYIFNEFNFSNIYRVEQEIIMHITMSVDRSMSVSAHVWCVCVYVSQFLSVLSSSSHVGSIDTEY